MANFFSDGSGSRRTLLRAGLRYSAAGAIQTIESTAATRRGEAPVDPITELIKFEVKSAHWVRENQKSVLGAPLNQPREKWMWVDYGFRWPAFTLAHLFTTPHPENTLFRADWCAELAMRLIDKEADYWLYNRDRGRPIDTGETPHYAAAYVLERLADHVTEQRRTNWLAHEEAWAAQALVRPLGLTGGYHDSWRMTGLYRLGQVLGRAEWREMGVFLFKQLLALQTREGFWEDDRHHGPSARYCGVMLPSLARMYRWTGDDAFGKSARRLADFLATYSHPDSATVGPFDGRNSNIPAFYPICPGFELTPRGRAYGARAFALWRHLGMFDDILKSAQSTRDFPRLAFYAADTCEYLGRYAPNPEQVIAPQARLPLDRDVVLGNHTSEFDGLMARRGPWVLALSSQNSQIRGVYRLERQSRIEIWHEQARVVIGGGHNHQDEHIPHANVILDNGYGGLSAFGTSPPGVSTKIDERYYRPRITQSGIVNGTPELRWIFGHGTVRFRFSFVAAHQAVIDADWQVRRVQRLCLQLPLVLWRDSELRLDGQYQNREHYALREARRQIEVRGGPFAASFVLETPAAAGCRVHYPLLTGVFHNGYELHRKGDPIHNPFELALVSCQWTKPPDTGKGRFVLRLV
jgi:hypothetical protein